MCLKIDSEMDQKKTSEGDSLVVSFDRLPIPSWRDFPKNEGHDPGHSGTIPFISLLYLCFQFALGSSSCFERLCASSFDLLEKREEHHHKTIVSLFS